MTSIVAQRKAAIEAQLRATTASASVSTPASASVAASTQPSQHKKYNIKRVRKVSEKSKRGWGFTKTTYVIKHEQYNSPSPPLSSASEPVPREASTRPLPRHGAQPLASQTKPQGRLGVPVPQPSETQPPIDNVYYSEILERISLQHSEQEDFDYPQPQQDHSSNHLDQDPHEALRSAHEQQPSVVAESTSERPAVPPKFSSIQRVGSRAVPSPLVKRKPVIREMADTNPAQRKEYEGSWQAKKMVPPQPQPGMPTPDMAAAAAQKYNQNQKRIQKAVRVLEGEEEPPAKRGCCVIL